MRQEISNKAKIERTVAEANMWLGELVKVCFERIDNSPVNVDPLRRRLRVVTPWSNAGAKKWGLRASEALVLRSIVLERAKSDGFVFDFNSETHTWHLSTDYRSEQQALSYLERVPISAKEWLRFENRYRDRATDKRKRARRQREDTGRIA